MERDTLKYDPDTGVFDPPCKPGPEGYRRVGKELAHRVAWRLGTGEDPGKKYVDHVNGDRSDNRLCNLRLVTPQQNAWNRKAKGYTYIEKRKQYRTGTYHRGTYVLIGYFDTEEEAAAAYAAKTQELRGEYCRKTLHFVRAPAE